MPNSIILLKLNIPISLQIKYVLLWVETSEEEFQIVDFDNVFSNFQKAV